MSTENGTALPRVLIIGGGFGGLAAAKAFKNEPARVILLDRTNHHLFQPLLYQVATAGLSPAHIAQPIRAILNDADNVEIVLDDVTRIDPGARKVVTREREYEYDYLIVATGARHSYFGHDEWEKFAPGLKSIDDALEIRRRMLTAFEVAEKTTDPKEREAALTFVVVGGGPTGVEMAGAIAEIARHTMVRDFHHIDSAEARVILLDGAPKVLQAFGPGIPEMTLKQLEKIHVEVRLNTPVKNVTADGVEAGGEFIRARTVVWAAGNAASPLVKTLGVETDRAGRVMIRPDLTIPGHNNVFVIGDTANFSENGKPLPGVSPVAMQQGRHAAANILRAVNGEEMLPFKYFDKGSMATIGRNKAVVDAGFLRFGGFLAWLAWLFVHLVFLIGFRNRVSVLFQWMWAYFNYSKGARLITGGANATRPGKLDEANAIK